MEDRAEFAESARSYDGQLDRLHRALQRKQNLLQKLKEQRLLEELHRPHTWGGSLEQYKSHYLVPPPPPLQLYPVLPSLPAPPAALAHPPRIIQQTIPQQPPAIIQQLPQQQPQPHPAPRSGSIKEDMVELMLMQNAQMHQIIMHNMMLKAIPPMALSPPGGPGHYAPSNPYFGQNNLQGYPIFIRPDVKTRSGAVHHHHHHHGPNPGAPQLPPISHHTWVPGASVPAGQAGGHLASMHHATPTFTLPPLNV